MIYNPKTLNNKAKESLLLNIVSPRPIAVVTTTNVNNIDVDTNIAPFSLFNLVSIDPPIAYISVEKTKPSKRTTVNIKKTKEFVINIPNYEIAERMNKSAAPFPLNTQDKFKICGLTKIKSKKVKTYGIKECLIRLECKLYKVINFKNYEMFLGEIVSVYCDDSIIQKGEISIFKHKFIARLGHKALYSKIGTPNIFNMKRQG